MRLHGAAAFILATLLALGCEEPKHPVVPKPSASAKPDEKPAEPHLGELRQLTFGGENAEAYWSNKGDQLILQARTGDMQCDRIFRMNVADPKQLTPISNGKGATTCSYFLPGDQDVIYASTQAGGDACPPKPGMEHGYTWALYDSYDIYRAKADGSGVVRLTDTPGYDAEATVCKKDGSIVFTSVRDGDIELYRMDADGKNVKRLTDAPGYDGGAFFSDDCSKIVWRASRPKGKALEDFKSLLAKGLVRPTKLELMVANADGSEPYQITYLNSASFGPYLFPDGKRVVFSSNYGDPKGREFELWAINTDGTQLERITSSPGFDGFPMFSPDGKTLSFSSNRATAPGSHDTNVFLAKWQDTPIVAEPRGADRVAADVRWLADPARGGRGVGMKGLEESGAFVEKRMADLKLQPAGEGGGFRQPFDVTVALDGSATLSVDNKALDGVKPLSFSAASKPVTAELVLAGYGIETDKYTDYKGVDVKGKIAVVRRFTPDEAPFESAESKRKNGDLRRKAWLAKQKGAVGLLVVDLPVKPKGDPKWEMPAESKMPGLSPDSYGDAGIPAAIVPRAALAPVVDQLAKKKKLTATLGVELKEEKKPAFNVIGRIPGSAAAKDAKTIVIGAHYDHLGMGEFGSMAPGQEAIHPGADDNASGTAAILEAARGLAERKLQHDVVIVAFSGEERGVLGSNWLVKHPVAGLEPKNILGMINLDMVGRVRANKIDVIGHDTASEFDALIGAACEKTRLECALAGGGGYGPSDHASFYAADVPVMFLFSGTHGDYHKPSDTPDKLNYAGLAAASDLAAELAAGLDGLSKPPTLQHIGTPAPKGDARSFGASLGTIPDYAGSEGKKGVLLAGVRPGGAAELAGAKRGDLLIKIGKSEVGGVEDLMFVLGELKPKQKVKLTVVRDGKNVELDAEVQAAKSH